MKKTIYYFAFYALFFSTQALSNQNAVICGQNSSFSHCPEDKITYLKYQTLIPTLQDDCSNGDAICIGGDLDNQPQYSSFAIFDVDNNLALKYQLKIYPKVVDMWGRTTQNGRVDVFTKSPTQNERDFVKHLHDAVFYHKEVQNSLIFTQKNGTVYAGQSELESTSVYALDVCKTALNYFNNDNDCRGVVNSEIDLAVRNSPSGLAMADALAKASGLITLVTGGRIQTSDLAKFTTFKVIFKLSDNSKIVIDVKYDEGAVEIDLNLKASRAADGSTLSQLLNSKNVIKSGHSADELESLLNNPNSGLVYLLIAVLEVFWIVLILNL